MAVENFDSQQYQNKSFSKAEQERDLELPILAYKKEIQEMISQNPTSIIVGETGSGKTTRIPLFLLETLEPDKKIAITQPRRVAARSVARFVADQVHCQVGEDVGYQVRFDDHTTEGTRINFMTDGILLRKIQEDQLLLDYEAVMVDEAHERSLNIDFALGLLKQLQKKRLEANVKPLKIIVSSATLEKEKFASYFSASPLLEVPGRLYPVDIHYEAERPRDYTEAAANKVAEIIGRTETGDILIFMPGQEEIDKTIKEIEKLKLQGVIILSLYGQMSAEEQDRIFEKTSARKIVVATNIAETSVTVPGIKYIIDSGLIKQTEFDPQSGIESLVVKPHAKSGCIQRAGRAGRLGPGECYRLYTEEDFYMRPEFQVPEIKRSNLAHVVLLMKQMGIEDVKSFDFIDPPDSESFKQALETLKTLGALDDDEKITKTGEVMAELPLEPHISRMVIEAQKHNCVETICTIAAFLGNKSVFVRPKEKTEEADEAHRKFKIPTSDFLTLLKVWEDYEAHDYNDTWARENFLNSKVLREVQNIRYQLFRVLHRNGIRATESRDEDAIGKSIAAGLVENLLEYNSRHAYQRIKDGSWGFYIHPSSVTFGEDPQFIVAAEIVSTNKTYARVNQQVKREWLKEIAPQFISEAPRSIYYDEEADKVIQEVSLYLKQTRSIVDLEKRQVTGEQAVEVFVEALMENKIDYPLLEKNLKVVELINKAWLKSGGKLEKEMSNIFTRNDLKEFYKTQLHGISSKQEMFKAIQEGKINLELNINEYVSPEHLEEILRNNPDTITLDGKEYQVAYEYDNQKKEPRASITMLVKDVLNFQEVPQLPSGRLLALKVLEQEDSSKVLFESDNISEARQKARVFLINKQWKAWRESQDYESRVIRLENFNPLTDELPALPDPVQFGIDPESNKPLLAYPAIIEHSTDSFAIVYFSSQEEARNELSKTLARIDQLKEIKRKKEEAELLLEPTKELLKKVTEEFEEISDHSSLYRLDYSEREEIRQQLWEAKSKLTSETKQTLHNLQQIEQRLQEICLAKEERDRAKEKAKEMIKKYFSVCPLCGQDLIEGRCNNYHDLSLIDIDDILASQNSETSSKDSVVLSQLITDQGAIIAQLKVGLRRKKRSFEQGTVFLVTDDEIEGQRWLGDPFESVKFEDLGRVLTEDQLAAKEIERAKIRYQESLKYAQRQVEEGVWRLGSFVKSKNPKTGEEQWELTTQSKGLVIKYVVNRWSRQPTAPNLKYYFQIGKSLVDTKSFKLFLVDLQEPFPEDKLEESLTSTNKVKQEQVEEPDAADLEESIAKLREKWNKI